MSEIKKAIEGIETGMINGHELQGWIFHEIRREPLLTALAALRAEEEREKVMEWGKMESSGGVLAICPECKYPVSWWHKTPFCGNCGRKLDGGGQDGC